MAFNPQFDQTPSQAENGAEVFISYSHQDRPFVESLVGKLRESGVRCWYDQRINPGDLWTSALTEKLESAAAIVVVVSHNSRKSVWVDRELCYAWSSNPAVPIIPVRIDRDALLLAAANQQHIDAIGGADPMPSLLQRLLPLLGASSQRFLVSEYSGPSSVDLIRRGRSAIACCLLLILGIIIWDNCFTWGGRMRELPRILEQKKFICYDAQTDELFGVGRGKADLTLERDLDLITSVGFDGIVTFGSSNALADLPRMARRRGMSVIMGVFDPANEDEIHAAVRNQDEVDAYVVGYNSLGDRYDLKRLIRVIRFLQQRTNKPVSTTTSIDDFLSNKDLLESVDWISFFVRPHVTPSLGTDKADAYEISEDSVLEDFLTEARRASSVGKISDKPIVLMAAAFPHDGVVGASPETQSAFFRGLIQRLADPNSAMRKDVRLIPHSAFDSPWKTASDFESWERSTGLIDDSGNAMPAALEFFKRIKR